MSKSCGWRWPFGVAQEVAEGLGGFDETSVDAAGNDCIMRPSRCSGSPAVLARWPLCQLFKNETTDRCGFLIWGVLRERDAKRRIEARTEVNVVDLGVSERGRLD